MLGAPDRNRVGPDIGGVVVTVFFSVPTPWGSDTPIDLRGALGGIAGDALISVRVLMEIFLKYLPP